MATTIRQGMREPDSQLDRLVEIELNIIPSVRSALSEWVDDPYLEARLRELRDEARALRLALDLRDAERF